MIHGVTLLGLVVPGETVPVQGPAGPVHVSGEPAAPLVVFRLDGWEPDPEGGPYGPDEAQGHRTIRLMEEVGCAVADDRIDAPDVARLALALKLPGGRVIEVLVPVTEQVIRAIEDDGRIDPQEALAIAGSIVSGVMRLRA